MDLIVNFPQHHSRVSFATHMKVSIVENLAHEINIDVMTTVTVTTVGVRRRCPRMQEQRRGSGVAPDPDKWLTMRTVSAGGGHGPILLGKLEAGGLGQLRRPRDLLIPT